MLASDSVIGDYRIVGILGRVPARGTGRRRVAAGLGGSARDGPAATSTKRWIARGGGALVHSYRIGRARLELID